METTSIEYDALAVSPIVNGEVKLTIGENALTVTSLFDTVDIPYADINTIGHANFAVTIEADSGDYMFSRMGNWCQPFYDAACDAYNAAVLRSLFVEGEPILTANGEYCYTENGKAASGSAPVHVYENCVVVLPPDLKARRVPFCFVIGMDKGDYSLKLTLETGDSYTFSKLGYDTAPFADAVEKQIRKLREKTLAAVRELDSSLTSAQASLLAKLMPEGAAAPFGQFRSIAPSFAAALEAKIMETRAAESYSAFKELCDPALIWVGFKKNSTTEGDEAEPVPPEPYMLWMIAPSPDEQFAAVEFAQADSATFVYSTGGDFGSFARQLNRALEAISFRREVIRLSDDELRRPGNSNYYMAAKRTASLQFVRAGFAGRVIHSSPEAWKRKLIKIWSAAP